MLVIKVTALFALICLSLCTAEIRNTFKKHGISKSTYTVHTGDLTDNLYAEIKCENTTKASKPTKCQVSQETLDGKYKAMTCEVELDNYVDNKTVIMHNLDKDKVVITWWSMSDKEDHQFIRNSIVHLSECKVFEANIKQTARDYSTESWSDLKGAFLNRGDGTFDVFYYIEDSKDIRRVTFDAQGHTVAGPADLFGITQNFQSLTVLATAKKDLHLVLANNTGKVDLFGDDGSSAVIKSIDESIALSVDHDTIRLCSVKKESSDIVCNVFSQDGKLTTTNNLGAIVFDEFYIKNLANNEFILFTTDSKAIHVAKYGADGKQHGKLESLTAECKNDSETSGNELLPYSSGDERCVARLCYNEKEFDVINYCFKNQDIK